MKKKHLLLGLIAGVFSAGLFTTTPLAQTAHADMNIYRLYNPNTGEHFYTSSTVEKAGLVNGGWIV